MANTPSNPLLSGQSTDSGLQVILHPLPILNLSDRITRSSVRKQRGPVVVALLGQLSGLGITAEESFDCKAIAGSDGGYSLDADWFSSRLEQMRLVYKQPQLDLVGWCTLLPESGPTPDVLPIHKFLLSNYNESAILLGFHLEGVLNPVGGKLPITVYESNYEAEGPSKEAEGEGEDKEMRDGDVPSALTLKFRQLPYSIETGEAEMIGMAFVHKGAANATAAATSAETDPKGKRRADLPEEAAAAEAEPNVILSHEEQDLIAALSSKKNAIQMLKKRVDLFTTYLQQLPPSYSSSSQQHDTTNSSTIPSNNILRAIQALQTNLGLLLAPTGSELDHSGQTHDKANDAAEKAASRAASTGTDLFSQELLSEANNVHLVALLGDVLESIEGVRDMSRQFSVIEAAKAQKMRMSELGSGHGSAGAVGGGGVVGTGGGGAGSSATYNLASSGDIMHVMH